MTRGVLVALAILGTASAALATDETGHPAFHYLNLGTGPRLEALGETGASLGDGADAMDWNPARLAAGHTLSASAAWFNWLHDVQGLHAAVALPFAGRMFGVTARSLSVGEFSNVDSESPVDQSDVALGVGVASHLFERLAGGASLKLVRSSLAGEDATGWAADAGLDYAWVPGWDIVAAVRNLGPAISYGDGVGDWLPTQSRFGVGGTVRRLRFGVEGVWDNGTGLGAVAGAEYHLFDRFALRAGSRLDSAPERATEPWAVGFGLEPRPGWSVDYSFRDGELDASHRLGLTWSPRGPEEKETARSAREFYTDMLNRSLEKSLAGFPGEAGTPVVVRATKADSSADVVTHTIAAQLRARGFRSEVRSPVPALPESVATAQAEALKKAGMTADVDVPLVEVEIKSSRYDILSSRRERWIGPKTVRRSASVDYVLTRKLPGEQTPSWTSAGDGNDVQTIRTEQIPSSEGWPQPTSGVGNNRPNPFVEPAIVVGIVAGLAVIFFSNRDVGN